MSSSMKTKRLINIFGVVILFLLNNSCSNENASKDSLNVNNEVLIIINEDSIGVNLFKKVFLKQKKIFKVQNIKELKKEELVWLKNRVLDELIKDTLLSQEIKKNNISVEESVLNDSLKETREGYREGDFLKFLDLYMQHFHYNQTNHYQILM